MQFTSELTNTNATSTPTASNTTGSGEAPAFSSFGRRQTSDHLPPRLPCPYFDPRNFTPGLRIVIISDTHNTHAKNTFPHLPPADVILHAGDFTSTGKLEDIENFVRWYGNLDKYKKKIFIAGNHELTLDTDGYIRRFSSRFHRNITRNPAEYSQKCKDAVVSVPELIFLLDSSVELKADEFIQTDNDKGRSSSSSSSSDKSSSNDLTKSGGGSRIDGAVRSGSECCETNLGRGRDASILCYGSPYSPEFMDWGFNLQRGIESQTKWASIPDGTDVLLTHGPPYGYGDRCQDGFFSGCKDLLHIITEDEKRPRLRPRLHVFGHIHEDYGAFFNGKTLFINGSTCALTYQPSNKPILVHLPFDKSLPACLVDY